MTQENKELLLKDLCARLPYGVKISKVVEDYISESKKPKSINTDGCIVIENEPFDNGTPDLDYWYICEVKPYLRPMSSMTEEEKEEFKAFHCVDGWHPEFHQAMCNLPNINNMINWLDKKMFDHRGLIPKGLALEAPEGMYN